MQQTQDADTTTSKSKQADTAVPKEPKFSSRDRDRIASERLAVDEAKRLLSEIAGVKHKEAPQRDNVKAVRSVLLFPLILLKLLLNLILYPLSKLDLSLVHDMRRFLAHPGHFFWFNRLAPDRAAKHFRTTSTDAMTHHVRRYGAHLAMLVLAAGVVLGGGFGKFIKPLLDSNSAKIMGPDGSGMLIVDGDMHLLYLSTLGDPTANIPHRIQTYEAKAGDALSDIATANNISLDTLLYANLMVDPDTTLSPGQKLVIPPVDGMLHIVNSGDTIEKIASRYQVEPQVIINYAQNNLQGTDIATPLKPGLEVMVPNGVLPPRTADFLYTVKPDDTIEDVAGKFGITPETILYNNDISGKTLKPGQQIVILPVSGIEYSVKPGDSLQNIASRYSLSLDSIKNYPGNNISQDLKLVVNTTLYLPDAVPPIEVPIVTPLGPVTIKIAPPAPKKVVGSGNTGNVTRAGSTSNTKPGTSGQTTSKPAAPTIGNTNSQPKPAPAPTKGYVAPAPVQKPVAPVVNKAPPAPAPVKQAAPVVVKQAATGRLVWPIGGVITTYFHQQIWYGIHQGLDIATAYGTPCVAADSGVVIEAGWNPYGYGISVLIDHGNGMQTRYGHFSGLAVHRGQYVNRGQVIGYEGSTGNSSGPHVHFEVHMNGTIVNPLNYLR